MSTTTKNLTAKSGREPTGLVPCRAAMLLNRLRNGRAAAHGHHLGVNTYARDKGRSELHNAAPSDTLALAA